MEPVKTLEDARALPEVEGKYFDYEHCIDESGHTTLVRRPRPFVPVDLSGDAILNFIDVDGRVMEIAYTEDGPRKVAV